MSTGRPRIAVDFDGPVHLYSRGWQDGSIYDPPALGVREALRQLAERFDVVCHTTRATTPTGIHAVQAWLEEHDLAVHFVQVTAVKPLAVAYIDGRAVRWTTWPVALMNVLGEEYASSRTPSRERLRAAANALRQTGRGELAAVGDWIRDVADPPEPLVNARI